MGVSNSKFPIIIVTLIIILAGAVFLYLKLPEKSEPARFNISNIEINPSEAKPGENVIIEINLENTGGKIGTHAVELKLNGSVTEKKNIKLGPGERTTVTFSISKNASKTYYVNIGELSGKFRVLEPAKFEIRNLSIQPLKSPPGEPVNISVQVSNFGEVQGNHTVELKIDGVIEKSKTVSLIAGEKTEVSFSIKKSEVRFYLVEIGKLTGRFELVSSIVVLEWGGQGGGGGLFNYPAGIAVDNNGFVYVADTLNYRIQKFSSNGTFITMWGKKGYGAGEFNVPLDVDVDNKGFVYVAEGNGHYVQKFTSDGTFVKRWDAQVRSGIAVDDGFVYVTATNSIKKFTSDGEFVVEWGSEGSENGQFTEPSGIAIDNGFVYVAELDREGNHQVQKFTKDGVYVSKWSLSDVSSSWWPLLVGITIDTDGNVYVSNPYNSVITKFDSNGNILSVLDDKGSGTGKISNPQGICIDNNGNIFVSDRGNYRIQKFDRDFSYLEMWGSFGGSGSGYFNMPLDCDIYENDTEKYLLVNEFWNCRVQKFHLNGSYVSMWGTLGRGSGEFEYPEAFAVDKNGFVYVSDSGNNRIQKFDLDGNFITEWGSRGTGEGEFHRNVGVEVDGHGEYVYVVDMGNDRVQKFESDGTYVTQWRTEGAESNEYSPRGIAIDESGFVYISEEGPHNGYSRVQKFTSEGVLVKLWYMDEGGSTGTPRLYDIAIDKRDGSLYVFNVRVGEINKFTSEGDLIKKWEYPGNGIAVDSDGFVYIVDTDNDRILKLLLCD